MSRRSCARLTIRGALVALTPLHVGGMPEDDLIDMPLARDGSGALYIPGTSLAGVLRDWFRRHRPGHVERLWGPPPRGRGQKNAGDQASLISVGDALLPDDIGAAVRSGVGIDRVTGTAAREVLYERGILPVGTKIPLYLDVVVPEIPTEADLSAALGTLLAGLEQGVRLGAGRSRGLGRLRLETDWRAERFDLASPHGVLRSVLGQGDDRTGELRNRAEATVPSRLVIELDWLPVLPTLSKARMEVFCECLPLLTESAGNGVLRLTLPGSSIKGVLRSQAERILNTLLPPFGTGVFALPATDRRGRRFLDQLARHDLVRVLFGDPGQGEDNKDEPWLYGRGALSVDDCFAAGAGMDRADWNSLLKAGKKVKLRSRDARERQAHQEAFRQTLRMTPASAGSRLHHTVHNAIDRWTGGAKDEALFDALEPQGVTWEPIRLEIDGERLPADRRGAAAMTLLVLVLRDLCGGWLTLGFGGNRGLGEIKVTRLSLRGVDPVQPGGQLDQTLAPPFDFTELPRDWVDALQRAWTDHLADDDAKSVQEVPA